MSCIITHKGKKYSEEQFKEYFINNKQEFATSIAKNKDVIDSFKRKMEAIDGVFKDSPELASIGSKAQYLQYLSTIFPNSKVKDIVYHGTNEKFDVFDFTKEKTDPFTKDGAYFATIPYDYKEKLPALLNIKNPKEFADITDTLNKFGELEKSAEFDSAIGKSTAKGYENYREYAVFEPEQIHLLGGKNDINGFKQFVNKNTTQVVDSGIDTSKKINIYAGTNENAELSNFAIRPFKFVVQPIVSAIYGEKSFDSVEQAFQWHKGLFAEAPAQFGGSGSKTVNLMRQIKNTKNGAEIKKLGQQFNLIKAKQWDSFSSVLMKDLLKASFEQNPEALQKLLATGNAELTHIQDKGKWGKEFPKLLMGVRQELKPNVENSNDISDEENWTEKNNDCGI